jgi:hypothetical protein
MTNSMVLRIKPERACVQRSSDEDKKGEKEKDVATVGRLM